MNPPPKPDPHRPPIGSVVSYHKPDVHPGVRRGVILDVGKDGVRVMDRDDGGVYDVKHGYYYTHRSGTPGNFKEIVAELIAMGIPVALTDQQKAAMEHK